MSAPSFSTSWQGTGLGAHAGDATLRIERGPVARGVVADGVGDDIAVVQIGKPLVEALRLVGGTVVTRREAGITGELQPRLEAGGEVVEAADRLGARVDQEHRDRHQLAMGAVDPGGVGRTAPRPPAPAHRP